MKNFAHKFKKSYLRIFLTLSIIFTVIIMLFSIFLSSQFSEFSLSEIDKFNHNKVLQTVDNFEFVLNKLRTFGMVMYEEPDIHNWLFSDAMEPLTIGAAVNRTSKMLLTEPFIYKSYLINMRLKLALDSKEGSFGFDVFPDERILDIITNNRPGFLKYFDHKIHDKDYFALIIPSTPSQQDSYGYLVLLIDKGMLKDYLLQSKLEQTMNVVVLDQGGQLLLGSMEGEMADGLEVRAHDGEAGKLRLESSDGVYAINYATLHTQEWRIYFITPIKELMASANSFKNRMLIFSTILLILQFAVIFWNSRRTYKPYENLAEQVQNALVEKNGMGSLSKGSYNEYNVIKGGIEMLVNSVNELKGSIREHKELIKSDYLSQWVNFGKMNQPIKEYVRKNTKLLDFHNLIVVVLRIESYLNFSSDYDFLSRKLLKYGIGNIVNELMDNNGWAVETIDMGSDHMVSLVGCNHIDRDALLATLDNVRIQVKKCIQIEVSVATSEKMSFDDDLKYACEHIYELTMLKFLWGKDKVYVEKDFEEYLSMIQPMTDEKNLEELVQAVRLGHAQKIEPLLDKLMNSLTTMTYAECKFQLTQNVYSLFKSFNKLTSIQGLDRIQGLMDSFNTLIEVKEWLGKELSEIADNLNNKKGVKRKDEIVMEIVEYIKNHLQNPILSAEDVAEHVSLSAGYVRQIFKEIYGITFSDYILEERISLVKKLLESTEWPIADIAERSGFQTKSYFFTAFKKAFGMTPSQYRNEANPNSTKNT